MSFPWPRVPEIRYRLWRLRRLIAVSVAVPLFAFAAVGLFGVGLAYSVEGLIAVIVLLSLVLGGHAVLFPNAYQETLSLSLGFTILGFFHTSFWGWLAFLVVTGALLIWGQTRLLGLVSMSRTHRPTFTSEVRVNVPMAKARAFFPLRPDSTRGDYRCGAPDTNGIFPVWYDAQCVDPLGMMPAEAGAADAVPTFYAVIEEDTDTCQSTQILDGPSHKANIDAVVEHRFKSVKGGCIVTEREAAPEYPIGQSAVLWLSDFAQDGLVYHRDLLEERESLSLRQAHRWSLLMLATKWALERIVGRATGADVSSESLRCGTSEVEEAKLNALLARLGPDYVSKGYSEGPVPLVSVEEFFDGNGDDASFQGAPIQTAEDVLKSLKTRDDVADIRLGVTQWDGPSTWPLAEYIYIVTTAGKAEVHRWLKEAGVWVDELSDKMEHRTREKLDVPDGHRVVWAWMD